MTLTDRIERAAPWGFWRAPGDTKWNLVLFATDVDEWRVLRYETLTPAQAADALENCEGCGGGETVDMLDGLTPAEVPCPTCASLRACVEALLEGAAE